MNTAPHSAPALASPPPASAAHARAFSPAWLAAAFIALAALGGTFYLWPFWLESDELSHGFFTPVLMVWLLARSRREPPAFFAGNPLVETALVVALVLVVAVAGMAALAQGVWHSQTAFLTGASLTTFIVFQARVLAGTSRPWINFNGTTLAAAALWTLAAPLPDGSLSRLTLWLQSQLTEVALHTVRFLGFPAARQGNVLEISGNFVGVEEACSGIISLVACIYAGVFLAGLLLRGWRARLGLVIAAIVLAVIGNLIRTVTLCLLVARGIDIDGGWHDWSGLGVLAATTAGLWGICQLVEAWQDPRAAPPRPAPHVVPPRAAWAWTLAPTAYASFIFVVVTLRQIPPENTEAPPPDLAALLSFEADGWSRRPTSEIVRFADALNTDLLHQETYRRGTTQVTFYMAYWPANTSTLGSVGVHTPDLCLPGAGWTQRPTAPAATSYPLAHPRRFNFELRDYPQHVWFWHFYGGHLVPETEGLLPWQLAPYLLRRPVSSRAAQWVLRVSSNEPLESLLDEPLLTEFFARVNAQPLVAR